MNLLDPIGAELLSRSIDWGRAQIKSRAKRKKIAELIEQTTTRASMISSCVDLGAKFKNAYLLEELLAHRALVDIGKDEAIRTFLGEEYDDSAYEFVAEFWNSLSNIISTEEESLATRKAVEGTEAANRKLDALLEVYGIVQKDGESQREIRKLLQRYHQTL